MVTDDVVRWRWCEAGLLPYRREPFLHERAWLHRGRWLDDEPDLGPLAGFPYRLRRVGFDADGRLVVVGPAGIAPEDWAAGDVVRVTWDGESSEAVVAGGRTVRYRCDASGRVVAREGDDGPEAYEHDERGWVRRIEEAPDLLDAFATVADPDDRRPGGPFEVVRDDAGAAVRLERPDGSIVWRALDEPFETWRDALARRLADVLRASAEEELSGLDDDLYALCVVYVEAGSLTADAVLGLAGDREDGWEALYPEPSTHETDLDLWDQAMGAHDALQQAALHAAGDPYRALLDPVCRELVARPPAARLTDDFVVYPAEHDEGLAEKVEAIRRLNPPDRAEAFLTAASAEDDPEEEDASWWGEDGPEADGWACRR